LFSRTAAAASELLAAVADDVTNDEVRINREHSDASRPPGALRRFRRDSETSFPSAPGPARLIELRRRKETLRPQQHAIGG
jgi:hypothetical protein